MPDPINPANGSAEPPAEEPRRTLREIAEESYDEVTGEVDSDASEPAGQEDRPRDNLGRFVKAEPGEAAAEEPPSPETTPEPTPVAEQPHPAPVTGEAAQAPTNWSAEVRARFQKLPQEDREFLLQRHHEMESDYQKRVQATAFSNQFVQAVTPVFNDPQIAESLRREGRTPVEFVYQMGAFHKRALSPELRDRVELLFELAQRMQIDPAAVFGLSATPVNGLSKEDMANPAVKKIADQVGQTSARIQALEAEIQRRNQAETDALVESKRAEIYAFADQKGPDGSLAHPYFDHFLPVIMEHYKANPGLSVAQCYEAVYGPVRDGLAAQYKTQVGQQNSVQRAQSAVRSNVRGMTNPVSRPAPNGARRSLREVIEETADEVGL
jgi:hypothetical protein